MSSSRSGTSILARSVGRRARLRTAVVVTVVSLGSVAACGGDDAAPVAAAGDAEAAVDAASARPAYGLVTPSVAAELAVDPDVVVIDVRTPEEFAEGHIAGALPIDFNSPGFTDSVAELDPAADYLVYCRSGNRSGQAVALMQQLGFQRLWDMDGGVTAWTAAGLPLVS